jgi:hypothetical protein
VHYTIGIFKGTSVNNVLKIMGVSTEITELLLGTFNKQLSSETTPFMTAKYPQKKLAKNISPFHGLQQRGMVCCTFFSARTCKCRKAHLMPVGRNFFIPGE